MWVLLKPPRFGGAKSSLQLTADDHFAIIINAVDLKYRLGNVETDCRDRLHGRIVLLPFDVRLDVGRRHQPHGMAKCLQLA